MIKQLHLIIKGKVQGVYYRQSTKQKAEELGIFGYVKNLVSGDVEIMAQGEEEKLNSLLDWCRRGPQMAKVTNIKHTLKETANKKYSSFNIN
jgi:acylphosphatase